MFLTNNNADGNKPVAPAAQKHMTANHSYKANRHNFRQQGSISGSIVDTAAVANHCSHGHANRKLDAASILSNLTWSERVTLSIKLHPKRLPSPQVTKRKKSCPSMKIL